MNLGKDFNLNFLIKELGLGGVWIGDGKKKGIVDLYCRDCLNFIFDWISFLVIGCFKWVLGFFVCDGVHDRQGIL